jgi:hypothetical protein
MRLILIGLLIGLVHSAKADICCPGGCVPLNNGTLTCVKAGTNQSCGSGSICGGSGGGGGGGGSGGNTYVSPPNPPSACGLWLQCGYANGFVRISIQGSEVRYNGPPPTEQVLGFLVYSDPKSCVGALTPPLKLPVTGQEQRVNLYTLNYLNCGSASPPMSFRATMGARPTLGSRNNLSAGTCGCSVSLPAPPSGPNTCREGFIWRAAFPGDAVCVSPTRQAAVQAENQQAAANRAGSGAFGANTCKSGLVWRAAGPSDNVCVTVQSRGMVQQENANQWSRVAHIAGQ